MEAGRRGKVGDLPHRRRPNWTCSVRRPGSRRRRGPAVEKEGIGSEAARGSGGTGGSARRKNFCVAVTMQRRLCWNIIESHESVCLCVCGCLFVCGCVWCLARVLLFLNAILSQTRR